MIDLGLTVSELWDLTPYQINRLWKRHQQKKRAEAQNLAILVCRYLNVHRNTDEQPEPFKFNDFLPFPELNQEYAQVEQSTEEQVRILRRWAANMPGSIRVKRNV